MNDKRGTIYPDQSSKYDFIQTLDSATDIFYQRKEIDIKWILMRIFKLVYYLTDRVTNSVLL